MSRESFHEQLDRPEAIRGSSDRAFGFVIGGAALVVATYLWYRGSVHFAWAMVAAAVFLLASLARPALLSPLNRLWTSFGLLLAAVVSPLVLAILFYLCIAPTGLLLKALGKDVLRLKVDRSASSHWITRHPPGPAPDTLRDQF